MANIFRSSLWVLILSNFGNVFMYLFQVVLARKMNVSEFGLFNSVNSLSVIFTSVFGVIPYFITKVVIEKKLRADLHFSFLLKIFFLGISLLLFFMSVVFFFFDGKDLITLISFFLSVFSYFFLMITFGFFQSQYFHVPHSLFQLMNSIFKFLFVLMFSSFIFLDHVYALFSIALANFITMAFMFLYLLKHKFFVVKEKIMLNKKSIFSDTVKSISPTLCTLFFIGIYSNVDIFLVSIYSNSTETGHYSVLSILGRIAFFLPSVLIPILFPEVLNPNSSAKEKKNIFVIFSFITLLIGFFYAVFMFFYSEFVIYYLFGGDYNSDEDVIFIICLVMVYISIMNVIFNFSLARNVFSYIYINFLFLLLSFFVFFFVEPVGVRETAFIYFYCMSVIFIFNVIWFFWKRYALFKV